MQQISQYPLWLGHAGDGRNVQQLFAAGIRARVELAGEEAPAPTPRDLIACRFPLVDGAGNDEQVLALALRTVAELMRREVPTLVCCGAGMSRSPAVAAGALTLAFGERPEVWLKRIADQRPTDIAPALWSAVVDTVAALR